MSDPSAPDPSAPGAWNPAPGGPPPGGHPTTPYGGPPPGGYGPGPGGFGPPPGYVAPYGQPGYDPNAPYGRHPVTGEPYSDKSKLVAGLLQLFVGHFGAGRWYLGDTGIALGQLFTCGGIGIWALVDAIMILTGNVRDQHGRPLRD